MPVDWSVSQRFYARALVHTEISQTPRQYLYQFPRTLPKMSNSNSTHTTYLIHPYTHKIYKVPRNAIMYDEFDPISLKFDTFEELASSGSLSAEKIARVSDEKTTQSKFVIVRYGHYNAEDETTTFCKKTHKRCVWASRMITSIPDTESFKKEGLSGTIGFNFLWLWPAGKIWNTWASAMSQPTGLFEECKHLPPDNAPVFCDDGSVLGAHALLPTDIPGSTVVSWDELSNADKFFLMNIDVQDSMYTRRNANEGWQSREHARCATLQSRYSHERIARWTLHIESFDGRLPSRDECVSRIQLASAESGREDREQTIAKKMEIRKRLANASVNEPVNASVNECVNEPVNKKKKKSKRSKRPLEIIDETVDEPVNKKEKKSKRSQPQEDCATTKRPKVEIFGKEDVLLEAKENEWFLSHKVASTHLTTIPNDLSNEACISCDMLVKSFVNRDGCFGMLCEDITSKIFGHAVVNAMMASTETCKTLLQTLMLLCKNSKRVCEKIVSKHSMHLFNMVSFSKMDLFSKHTPVEVGAKFRTVGLTPGAVLRFKAKLDPKPKTKKITPYQYLEMRSTCNVVVDVTNATLPRPEETSEIMRATMAKLTVLNPKMWLPTSTHESKAGHDVQRKEVASNSILRMSHSRIADHIHEQIMDS